MKQTQDIVWSSTETRRIDSLYQVKVDKMTCALIYDAKQSIKISYHDTIYYQPQHT